MSKENGMDDLIVKQNIVNRHMDTKEERGRVMNWETEVDIKQGTNEDPL